MSNDKDWRESAYLRRENWPEAIPGMGPKREYGPYPWPPITHGHLDAEHANYPHMHVDACSIGDTYMGDVCPWCGVPLHMRQTVVRARDRERGELIDLAPNDNPVPVFHRECWDKYAAKKYGAEHQTLDSYANA